MRLLLLTLFLYGFTSAASQPESTNASSTNKVSSTKSTTNSIQTSPQKSTGQQSQAQYIPQYVPQKSPAPPQTSQQPAAMYILAQPASLALQSGPFQQAVHQLLNYYNTNPQAKYQLLQQQHPGYTQGSYQPSSFPQSPFPAHYQQGSYQHIPIPSGALHVIPSPQLNSLGHLPPAPLPGSVQYAFAIPSQGHFSLGPGLLSQFGQQFQTPHFAAHSSPIHSLSSHSVFGQALASQPLGGQPVLAHSLPPVATQLLPSHSSGGQSISGQSGGGHGSAISTTLSTGSTSGQQSTSHALPQAQALTQSLPNGHSLPSQASQQIPNHIVTQQATSHLPPQYTTSAQIAQYQPQSQFGSGLPVGSIAPHSQFGLKQNIAGQIFNTNEYLSQTEKSVQPSSNNYNPVYRTTYIKG